MIVLSLLTDIYNINNGHFKFSKKSSRNQTNSAMSYNHTYSLLCEFVVEFLNMNKHVYQLDS